MPSEFLAGAQVGANIASMAAQRQERMMALRSQEALRQIQERQTAAEAEMMLAHRDYYKAQAQKAADDNLTMQADLKGFADMVKYDTEVLGGDNEGGITEEDAILKHLPALNLANPVLGKKVADSMEALRKAKTVGQPTPLNPSVDARNQAAADASKSTSDLNKAKQKKVELETAQLMEGGKPLVTTLEDGTQLIYNGKTGKYERLKKSVTRQDFIDRHLNTAYSQLGDADAAMTQLNTIYDKLMKQESGSTNEFKQVGEFKVRIK